MKIKISAALVVIILLSPTASAYELMGIDWNHLGGNPITVDFKVNPNCADPTAPNELNSLLSALSSWTDAGANFAYNYDGPTNIVGYTYNGENTICWDPSSGGGALATTFSWYVGGNMLESDIVFWDQWTWNTSNPSFPQFDVESVGLHELGHGVGLDHSQYNWAVMWYSIGYAEVQRELSSDDLNGILAIYGSGTIPNIDITMTPYGAPITIPAGGGSFNFNVQINNNEASTVSFNAWIMTRLPNWSYYGPLAGPYNLFFPAGHNVSVNMTQNVPAGAPAGTYAYIGYVGSYPGTVYDSSYFNFTKSNFFDGPLIHDWMNNGNELSELNATTVDLNDFNFLSATPNPFNPRTTIEYRTNEPGDLSLTVFDIAGRSSISLFEGYRYPGEYRVEFDGSELSSGIYFIRLQTGNTIRTQKLLLLK